MISSKPNLRIALITDGFYPNVIGGMQKHSFNLARYLALAGVQVELYYPKFDGRTPDVSVFGPEESQHITLIPVAYPPKGNSFGHYIREEYTYARNIYLEFEKRTVPDFIIAKGFTAWEILKQKSKGKSFPPVGVNFHGYEMFQQQPGFKAWLKSKLLFSWSVKFNMQHADYLFSYGGKITSLIEAEGISRSRIIEVPTGISSEWLVQAPAQNPPPKRFVFAGRFERRKGVAELNEALRILLKSKADFRFSFVGDIPTTQRVASDKIYYHGKFTSEKDMQRELRANDVLVCPSYSEGMPNVILEAMASGCAIITTDTGATGVMVDSSNGWLIQPGSAQEIVGAMNKAIQMPAAELNQLRTSSVSKVKASFLWERVIGQTLREITEKLGAGN